MDNQLNPDQSLFTRVSDFDFIKKKDENHLL